MPCTTCTREANKPYRAYDPVTGEIIAGCVDSFHDDALVPYTVSHAWHYRPEAKRIRRASAARLQKLTRG